METNEAIVDQLKLVLSAHHTDAERKNFISQFLFLEGNLENLLPLLFEPHPVNMRFAWFLGDLVTIQPHLVQQHLIYLFQNRESFQILNFNRSLAKFFYYVGIPTEIESEVYFRLNEWLMSPGSDISTKTYVLKVLIRFSEIYPEFKSELSLNLERLLENKQSNTFYKLAEKTLKVL